MAEHWLLADTGGTNTRVGVARDGMLLPASVETLANADHAGLAPLLQTYLSDHDTPAITALCAGVAGPIRNGTAQLTNLDWFIDSADLRRITGATRIVLINDLQAQAYALDDLNPDHLTPLFPGATAPPHATRLVMGLGTGCNVAVAHDTPAGLLVPAAESGHSSLPYCPGELGALIDHLGERYPHRPVEAALSGPGLSNIFHWLDGTWQNPAQIIAGHHAGNATSTRALHLFIRLLGKVAGDLALAHLPMGGIYLIGGTARAVAPLLAPMGFAENFADKGPYDSIMRDIPIALIDTDIAALLGCARCLRQGAT